MARNKRDCPLCHAQGLTRLPLHLTRVHKLNSDGKKTWLNQKISNKKRRKKLCPIPHCETKVKRLAQHLLQVHMLDPEQRQVWLSETENIQKVLPQTAVTWGPSNMEPSDQPWWETQSLLPFQSCSSIIVSGMTGSGKTRWTFRLLQNLVGMFNPDPPHKLMYCYGIWQPLFDEMENKIPNLTMHQGLPSQEDLDIFTADREHNMIILDDLMQQVVQKPDMELLFTQGSHHRCLTVIFIMQNLFQQGKCSRSIALNTWYYILMKNMRDASQISTLGKQVFPDKANMLVEVYKDCMKEDYGYLILDVSPNSQDKYRMRTHVFPKEDPVVYIPNS